MDSIKVSDNDGYRTLCALRDFHQGEVILDLPQEVRDGPDKYSIEILPGIHIDCSSSLVGAINHSCEPNAVVRKGRIVAWSCIKDGDEITIDYKKTETKLAFPFNCNCGSKNCRRRIK
jgi:N-methylhydantoinase B/oxoprolinase/acetone carboxylase alpha subunit